MTNPPVLASALAGGAGSIPLREVARTSVILSRLVTHVISTSLKRDAYV